MRAVDSSHDAINEPAKAPQDREALATHRRHLRKALVDDPELADQLAGLVARATRARASGARAVTIGGSHAGTEATGDGATNTALR
ncbi:hypothetical protein [Streptomyces buecherae]|uniref:hypothetical protein n=1 Tax=Streptomyces buecherae TaxID=2763006 RepID=UPI00364CC2A3